MKFILSFALFVAIPLASNAQEQDVYLSCSGHSTTEILIYGRPSMNLEPKNFVDSPMVLKLNSDRKLTYAAINEALGVLMPINKQGRWITSASQYLGQYEVSTEENSFFVMERTTGNFEGSGMKRNSSTQIFSYRTEGKCKLQESQPNLPNKF